MNATSPWVRALRLPESDEKLKHLVRVPPQAGPELHNLSPQQAQQQLEWRIAEVYHPSAQDLRIIRKIVAIGSAHAMQVYATQDQFIAGAMGRVPLRPDSPVTMLTGHSGVGKSALLRAIVRLTRTTQVVQASESLPPFPLHPIINLAVRERVGKIQMLRAIVKAAGIEEEYSGRSGNEMEHARLRLYQQGCCTIMSDELQFVSQSGTANAQVATLLTLLAYLGVPVVYACNYSLAYKLKRRRPEDVVRLLAAPIVMLPEVLDHPAFLGYLQDISVVLGGRLKVDLRRDAAVIHELTFGLKRQIIRLVCIAYRLARESAHNQYGLVTVTMTHLHDAFKHRDYQVDRQVVSECQRALLGISRDSENYRCPFELEQDQAARQDELASARREQALSDAQLLAARTRSERLEDKEKARQGIPVKSQPVPKAVSRLRPPRTAADLLAGLNASGRPK